MCTEKIKTEENKIEFGGIFFLKIQNYHQWLWVMKYQPIHCVPFWTIDKEFLKCQYYKATITDTYIYFFLPF